MNEQRQEWGSGGRLVEPKVTALRKHAWLIAVAVFTLSILIAQAVYVHRAWDDVRDLDPNALGDMLAGFFAPLAFVWLVAGYMTQLRQLSNQIEGLRDQANHSRTVASSAHERVQQESARVQPMFVPLLELHGDDNGANLVRATLRVRNNGPMPVRRFRVSLGCWGDFEAQCESPFMASLDVKQDFVIDLQPNAEGWIRLVYRDVHGDPHHVLVGFSLDRDAGRAVVYEVDRTPDLTRTALSERLQREGVVASLREKRDRRVVPGRGFID